jgi:hypothetical protein
VFAGYILTAVATTNPAVTPATAAPALENSILLEAVRDGEPFSVTIHFAAIQELRSMVTGGHEVASGQLRGLLAEDCLTIEHCDIGASKTPPVGLFRTQPAGWPSVTEPDCQRMQAAMPQAGSAILMVVRTLARRPWSAALFLVHPRQPMPDQAALIEFPFDEYLLRNGWLTELAPPAPPPVRMPALRPKRRRRMIPAAAAVLALAGVVASYETHWGPWSRPAELADFPAPPQAVVPPIGLRATRSLDELEVSWNRGADLVRAATGGTLVIKNGSITRIVPVSLDQLHMGRIMYHPVSGVDVDFRLELTMPDGRLEAESIQVVGFDTTPSLTLPVAAQPRSTPPVVQSADRTATAPVTQTAPAALSQTEPLPIRRVNPTMTKDVLEEMRSAKGVVTISVLVNIDADGKVSTAKVVSAAGEPSPSGSYIRLAALNAARQWRFRPATERGRAVPSALTLAFAF